MMFFGRGVMRVSFRQHDLHFRHRDHGREADKKEKERSENSQGADESPDIDPGGNEKTPGRGEKIPVQAADDNDEALEPHAGVDAHADEVNDKDIVPAPSEPKELRRQRVAKEHADPPIPPVRDRKS